MTTKELIEWSLLAKYFHVLRYDPTKMMGQQLAEALEATAPTPPPHAMEFELANIFIRQFWNDIEDWHAAFNMPPLPTQPPQ